MNTTKVLNNVREYKLTCEELKEKIERLEYQQHECSSLCLSSPKVSGGKHSNRMLEIMIRLDNLYTELEAMQLRYEKTATFAKSIIRNLPDVQKKIIHMRYIDGARWATIQRDTGFSYRHCLRLQHFALERLKGD